MMSVSAAYGSWQILYLSSSPSSHSRWSWDQIWTLQDSNDMWYLTWNFIHVSKSSGFNFHVTEDYDLFHATEGQQSCFSQFIEASSPYYVCRDDFQILRSPALLAEQRASSNPHNLWKMGDYGFNSNKCITMWKISSLLQVMAFQLASQIFWSVPYPNGIQESLK